MNTIGKARTFTALPAVLVCSCISAGAADLPVRSMPPVPPPPPVFSWQGPYIGFNYGYAWGGSGSLTAAGAPLADTTLLNIWPATAATGVAGVVNGRLNGFLGGVQLGYNWQFADRIVLGLEADLQAGGINGGGGYASLTPAAPPGFSALTSATLHRSLEHFGTLRGRVGYAVTPTIFGYLTGGLAYGGANLTARVSQSLNPSLLATGNASADKFAERIGWTIGVGAEMAIAPNLSAKLEYLYYDLGAVGAAFPNFAALGQIDPITGASVATAMAARTRFNGSILRTGLNYRFGQGADASGLPSLALVDVEHAHFGDWSISITPYLWALGMNGTATALGNAANVNASFVDLLTGASSFPLEFAANTEIRNGPLSFYTDLLWTQIRFAGSTFGLRNPIAGAALAVNADARLKMTLAILEGGGTFELARWGYAGLPAGFTAIDAVAGLRYWRLGKSLSLDITGAANLPALGLSQVGGKAVAATGLMGWIDPFIGLRLRQQIDRSNAFYLKGDVGGFGVGNKFAWQGAGGYTHDFELAGFKWTGMIGYRALYTDYSQGQGYRTSGLNAVLHGPVTGLGMKF